MDCSQKEKRNDEKYNKNIDWRDGTTASCPLSKGTSSFQGNPSHERDRIPDCDPRKVEEEVSQSYLECLSFTRDKRCKETCDRGTNIGSKGEREHLM